MSAFTLKILALVTMAVLYIPMSPDMQTIVLYIHSFACFFMIGFESFIMINLFSEKTTVAHLVIGYSAANVLVGLVQNDIIPLSFSVFRVLTVIMLLMMLVFFFGLPAKKDSYPEYIKRSDRVYMPKKLFWGVYILVFISCIVMLAGPTAVAVVKNGVLVAYPSYLLTPS